MWLKLKILLGYVILLLLLVLTIHIFRKEQTRRNSLRQDEHELACIRHLAGETYAGLLGLATYGETVSVWDESDLGLYHTKKDSVCNMLQTLKRYVKSPEQQSRIDSLCLLLERKELLLDTVPPKKKERMSSICWVIPKKVNRVWKLLIYSLQL